MPQFKETNMSLSPFDFAKCINTKEYPIDFDGYSQWMMNKIYSCHEHYCMVSVALSVVGLSDKAHFDCLFYGLPKQPKLFIPYLCKKQIVEKEIEYLKEYYQVNQTVAKDYHELLTQDEIQKVKSYFENRGVK